MRKDFKTGSLIGLFFVAILMVWVATQQNLNIESRILDEMSETVASNIPAFMTSAPAEIKAPYEAPQPIQVITPMEKPATKRSYTVQAGDTLSEISSKFYGTSTNTQKIYEANKDKMKDASQIRSGMILVIPD